MQRMQKRNLNFHFVTFNPYTKTEYISEHYLPFIKFKLLPIKQIENKDHATKRLLHKSRENLKNI